jgi:serine/threonine protein kinase
VTRERWQQIESLFYEAGDLAPDRRAAFLDAACGSDADLRRQVEDLLASEPESAGFLDGAIEEAASRMIGARPGERLGAYRITRELGHGGMGEVYLAERDDDQFRMQVAIKLIRADVAPRRLLERFRAERQILATLDHPNIARLLDGGTAGDAPFLVMEYVQGEPMDRYCTRQAVPIRERLRLFRAVCEAVAYAHRSLVIHRDIKPSNILVTAEGVPKLLDFGIAKLVKQDEDSGGVTRVVERAMTPAYASPEVVRGDRVTTAADVYSLGALLYELLTERAPFHLTSSRAAEVERVICAEDPVKPGALDPRLRGDLENIVLMAMHKEQARRYASVEQLIADIDRYLTGYPVAARDDRLYRWGKFARRNRSAVAAGILAVAGMAGWLISLRAEQARTRRGFAQVRELAESMLFETDDALRSVSGTTAAREAIAKRGLRYLDELARESGADPRLKEELADAYERVADIQFSSGPNLGQPAGALESAQKALGIRQTLAARDPGSVRWQRKLAANYLHISSIQRNRNDPAGEQESLRAGSAILERLNRSAPDDPALRVELAGVYRQEGARLAASANVEGARDLIVKARDLIRPVLAKNPRDVNARRRIAQCDSELLQTLGAIRFAISPENRQEGLDAFHEAEQILGGLAAESPNEAENRRQLISVYTRGCGITHLLDAPEQIASCRKAALLSDEIVAADPADVAARLAAINCHHNLSGRMREAREDGADAELRRATEMADQLFAQRPEVVPARSFAAIEHQTVAASLMESGDHRQALSQAYKAVQLREPLLLDPNDNRQALLQARAWAMIGESESKLGNRSKAAEAWQTAIKLYAQLQDAHRLDPEGERDLAEVRRRANVGL